MQKNRRIGQGVFKWEAVTAICTFFLTLGVFVALKQVYVTKEVAKFDFMAKLDDEFHSERLEKTRKIIVDANFTNLDSEKLYQCEPLLDFFDKIGYLEEEGMIPLKAVDVYWGYWIERYWVICEKLVDKWNTEDPNGGYYDDLETLFTKLAKLSCKKEKMTNEEMAVYKDKIKKSLDDFRREESQCYSIRINVK